MNEKCFSYFAFDPSLLLLKFLMMIIFFGEILSIFSLPFGVISFLIFSKILFLVEFGLEVISLLVVDVSFFPFIQMLGCLFINFNFYIILIVWVQIGLFFLLIIYSTINSTFLCPNKSLKPSAKYGVNVFRLLKTTGRFNLLWLFDLELKNIYEIGISGT